MAREPICEPRVEVVNLNSSDGTYVGRPTPLGNPYVVGEDGSRGEVIRMYERWLDEQMDQGGDAMKMFCWLFDEMCQRGELVLACWCAPKRCHAEVIRDRLILAWRQAHGD